MLAWQQGHYLIRRKGDHNKMRMDYLALRREKDKILEMSDERLKDWFSLHWRENELIVEFLSIHATKDFADYARKILLQPKTGGGRPTVQVGQVVPNELINKWREFKAAKTSR